MREHIIKSCRLHYRHRHSLGHGRHAQIGRLFGTVKGIRKMITFIRRSGAFHNTTPNEPKLLDEAERERRDEEEWNFILERDNEMRTAI